MQFISNICSIDWWCCTKNFGFRFNIIKRSFGKGQSGKRESHKSKLVGALIAKKALEKNISSVVFDRNGYRYHGRVKALADTAREAGLKF